MFFATCNRANALEFLRQAYPSREIKDEGAVSAFLDDLELDKIRITDPSMHGQAAVIPGEKWVEEEREAMAAKAKAMHQEITGGA